MSRAYWSTKNTLGVRSFRPVLNLNGVRPHDPAAAAPKPAMTPVLLGQATGSSNPAAPPTQWRRYNGPAYSGPFSLPGGTTGSGGAAGNTGNTGDTGNTGTWQPSGSSAQNWQQNYQNYQTALQSGSIASGTSFQEYLQQQGILSQSSPTPTVQVPGWTSPQFTQVSSGGGTAVAPTGASSSQGAAILAQYNSLLATFNNYVSTGDYTDAETAYTQLQALALQLSSYGVQVTLPTPPSQAAIATATTATAAPTSTATTATTESDTDQIASWLSGSTSIGSYAIPNALLAGGVVIAFAIFMGRGKK